MKQLIFHFNLQARVISELAKKVFDVLRINPDKFEIEFSETRQLQVGRRNQRDLSDSAHIKSNKTIIGVPSNNVSCSSQGTRSRKSIKTNFHGCSDTSKLNHARDVEVHTGKRKHVSKVKLLHIYPSYYFHLTNTKFDILQANLEKHPLNIFIQSLSLLKNVNVKLS
jgi:hypothetical protein